MAEPGWTALRRQLAGKPASELLELLAELCRRSAEARRILAARLGGQDERGVFEDCRGRLAAEFAAAPARMPRLGALRKAIRDYQRARSDAAGTAALWLEFLEAGTQFGCEHDDLGDAYYAGLSLGLRELVRLLQDDEELRSALLPRLHELRDRGRRVGWTWGPTLRAAVEELE